MELQRYGFLLLMSLLLLTAGCTEKAGHVPTAMAPPYEWQREEEFGESLPADDCLPAEADGDLPLGIVGGEQIHKSTWLARGTVFLTQSFVDTDGKEKTSICTASLIDSNLVLTAAHCVDRSLRDYENLQVFFSTHPDCDRKKNRLQMKRKKVEALRLHPDWDGDDLSLTDRGDIAMVRISGRAPEHYIPLKLTDSFLGLTESTPVLVVGYGMLNANYYGDYGGPVSLRVAQVPGISDALRDILFSLLQSNSYMHQGGDSLFENSASSEMLYIDQTSGRGICGGDSGGPSVMKNEFGEDVITGVASFVMNPEDPLRLCGYVAAHTSVFYHKAWLQKTFNELRNSNSSKQSLFQWAVK